MTGDRSNKRQGGGEVEKRGGYSSSAKPPSALKPPRSGPAPGAKPSPAPAATTPKK